MQHHVSAQRFLLQPINEDASFHKIRNGKTGLFLQAPNVSFPRLDVVLCISLESTVQDTQQHTRETTSGLRLPLLLKTTPCSQTLAFASCLHFVQCTVLRQECQQKTELNTESLLRSIQDNVSHVITRLLSFHQQHTNVRKRSLDIRLRDELPILPARVLTVKLVRFHQKPRIDATHHGTGTHACRSRRRSSCRSCHRRVGTTASFTKSHAETLFRLDHGRLSGEWCGVCVCRVLCVLCGVCAMWLCVWLFFSQFSSFSFLLSLLSLFSLLSSLPLPLPLLSSLLATKHCGKNRSTNTAANFEAFACDLAHGSLLLPPPSSLLSLSSSKEEEEGTFNYRNISGEEFIFITVLN